MINLQCHSLVRCFSVVATLVASLIFTYSLSAQPVAPTQLCVGVNNAGFIELTWIPPANPDPFLNYQIFRDTGVGFQNIATIGPPSADLWVDFTADPTALNSYFIQSIVNGVTSDPTETVSNIALDLNASQLSIPQLEWNAPFQQPLPAGEIRIYRSIDSNPFIILATIPITWVTYNDTLYNLCTDTLIAYKVSYVTSGCEMFSQTEENEFRDNLAPPQPEIETVTVDDNDNVITYWYPVTVPDLNFYRIQSINVLTQQFINIGTVQEDQLTEFTYTNASTTNSTTIGVIAFDECNNEASFGTAVTSIYMEAIYTECSLEVFLSWSPYEGWTQGVDNYGIFASEDGGAPTQIAEMNFQSFFYSAEVEPNKTYCFWVEARANGLQRPARSNRACVETTYPPIAEYNYMSLVTSLSDNEISVQLLQDLNAQGTTYELYRAKGSGSFLKIQTFDQTLDPLLEYIDSDVDAVNTVNTYKWMAYDGCDQFISESNIGQNISLQVVADSRDFVNYLGWNAYADWDGGVLAYDVYRKTIDDPDYVLLASLPAGVLIYDDNVEDFTMSGGDFCYQIRAREGQNSFGTNAISESNKVCVAQQPLVWIPNTIVMNGQPENQIFKPVASFIDFDSYRMEIYNKWGERLFSSSNVEDGWDGYYKGDPVREDFYQYIISYRDGSGKTYIEQDVLYVLKY